MKGVIIGKCIRRWRLEVKNQIQRLLGSVTVLMLICGMLANAAEVQEDNYNRSAAEETVLEETTEAFTEEETGTDGIGETSETEEESSKDAEETEQTDAEESETENGISMYPALPTLQYQVHVQSYGWQKAVQAGVISGTVGQAKRLEAIKLQIAGASVSGGIEYRTHVQSYGWLSWVQNGELSGTTGEAKRLEAIQIRLTGELAEKYDVYYRVHAQTYGWLGWAKNGDPAGTSGYAKRLEAIQIVLTEKNAAAPGSTDGAYKEDLKVSYQSYVQGNGWGETVSNGKESGTTGQAKRLEAMKIRLENHGLVSGSVEYRTHVQTYGWQSWVKEGQMSGTTGLEKRLEAVEIRLTGEMAEAYDIYYRVHCQTFGWTGWAKNGESCGSEGYAKRVEALQVVLVKKGGSAPGSTENRFHQLVPKKGIWGVDVSAHQGAINWAKVKAEGTEFAMLRITKKNTTNSGLTIMEDPYFQKNAQGAIANGIQIGGYVYNYASTPEEAKAEAEFAVNLLKKYKITYPIAFDLEEQQHMTAAAKLNNMAMAKAFCDVIEAAGYKTYVYGSPSKLREAFNYTELASRSEIWLARYRWSDDVLQFNDEETRNTVYDLGYEGGNYTNLSNVKMWQYTCYGRVNGISGNVDLDLGYRSY